MLNQHVPVIGGWMHRRVLTGLTEAARTGNALAVQSLSVALAEHPDEDVRKVAAQALRKVNFTSGIDMMWSVWAATRSPASKACCWKTCIWPAPIQRAPALCPAPERHGNRYAR
jgi:hypothetical protein